MNTPAPIEALFPRESEIAAFAGTKDIRENGAFPGLLSRWLWQFYTHRLCPAGRWFLWPTLAFAFVGSISLDLQAYVPFLYCAAAWGVAFFGLLWAKPRVSVTMHAAARIGAGEVLAVDVGVTQTGKRPGVDMAVLAWRLPLPLDALEGDGVPLPTLLPHRTAHVKLRLLCRKRGAFTLRGVRVQSDFPFGLLNAYRFYSIERPLLVLPRFRVLHHVTLPDASRSHSGEQMLTAGRGDSFDLLGSRDYAQGDPVRWMDWRATARMGRPIVREWQQEEFLRAALVVDTFVPRSGWQEDKARALDAERAVSACASLAEWLGRAGWQITGLAAGTSWHALPPAFGASALDAVLDTLAAANTVQDDPFTAPAPDLLHFLHAAGTVLCLFTDWNAARAAWVRELVREEVAVKVVVVKTGLCTLDPATADVAGGVVYIPAADWDAGHDVL